MLAMHGPMNVKKKMFRILAALHCVLYVVIYIFLTAKLDHQSFVTVKFLTS